MALRDLFLLQESFQDDVVGDFTAALSSILSQARAETILELREKLDLPEGQPIPRTPKNVRAMASLDRVFRRKMQDAGYAAAVADFTGQFNEQFVFFEQVLDELSSSMKTPLPEPVYTEADLSILRGQQAITVASLNGVLGDMSRAVQRQALLSVGGLSFTSLTRELESAYRLPRTQATTIAATGLSSFIRSISDVQYNKIEQDEETRLRFTYGGPRDVLNRDWCQMMLRLAGSGQTWTRKQIDAMVTNPLRGGNQPPDVFVTCGGWNCRHQFYLASVE